MSIRWFKTFLAVTSHGSFAAAAQEIGVTPAAVSVQMANLESELGLQLFDRAARAAILNSAGRQLIPRAQELVDLYEGMRHQLGEQQLGGALSLGAIPPTFARLLPEALVLLRGSHPRIVPHVSTGVSSELMRRVEEGELDAALIGQPPFKLAAPLTWRKVISEPLVLLAPAAVRIRGLAETVANHPFIGVSRGSWTGRLVHATLRRHQLKARDAMELDSLETIAAMVGRGFGVSILPMAPSGLPHDPRVQVVLLTQPRSFRDIGLVFREGQSRGALVSALYDSLRAVPAERLVTSRRLAMDS